MISRYPRHLVAVVVAGLVVSSVWYTGFDSVRTDLLEARGTSLGEPSPFAMLLEPLRTLVIAIAVGAAIHRLGAATRDQAMLVAMALFAAFPAVLLIGSVIHGESSAGLAAIHAGDWLFKLVIAALVMRRYHYNAPAATTNLASIPADSDRTPAHH